MSNQLVFACQKCHRSLKVEQKSLQESHLESFREHFAESKTTENELGDSFILLTSRDASVMSGGEGKSAELEKQMRRLEAVWEMVTDVCEVEQPLCVSCNEAVLQELDRRDKEVANDLSLLQAQVSALSALPAPSPSHQSEAEAEEEAMIAELEHQLSQLQATKLHLAQERVSLEEEERKMEESERKFWKEYQDVQMQMMVAQGERRQLEAAIESYTAQLARLKRTNVLDDVFHIGYDGHFGTISGFRLGKLPSASLDWSEVNAGLGQVVLLLFTLAKQCNFTFSTYKLLPLGSFSKMCRADEPNTHYELYGSNDLNLGRLFWYRRFDTALMWLLACIKEFGEYANSVDNRFVLKYPIRNEMIGDVSIKLQFNQDAKWTKALKYLLLNLKLLLGWVCRQNDPSAPLPHTNPKK